MSAADGRDTAIHPSTPLPWAVNTSTWKSTTSDYRLTACGIQQDEAVYGDDARAICYAQTTGQISPKNAAYIVQACNAFPALVAELRTAIAWIEDDDYRYKPSKREILPQLRAALAQAEVSE